MQMLGIENVVELSYAPKRRNVYTQEGVPVKQLYLSVFCHF